MKRGRHAALALCAVMGMAANQPANRLIHEKSPYLLQHAHNPVDWYPWGEEAFAKAQQEQQPIFLSIGYSTCHWCHVMEHESFENPQIARLLNQSFISIKVDREEHPDVDQVYMSAVTAMTGQGGWPLTAFLTPDRKPFFGGTYFPPQRRWNVPGLEELLPAVAKAWQERREELIHSADQLTRSINDSLAQSAAPSAITPAILEGGLHEAVSAFDASTGGFGSAPKFPRSHELSFLLRSWARTADARALQMVTTTLDHLMRGGIHDHLGGGFHRYATDAQWLVPHFEKMLYDQALLATTFVEAYQATHQAAYAATARDIFDYVLRALADPDGGFYAAEDADSEGEEGKFYVWTPEEIIQVLGREEGQRFCRFYGVTSEGNFEHRRSILHIEQLDDTQQAQLAQGRAKLFAVRQHRVRPHRDDQVLASWNGLMIAALADGAGALDEPRYLAAAARAANFVATRMVQDGKLLRRYRDGEARYPGTLEDYAFFANGLVKLYEASGDPRWLSHARQLTAQMMERFQDTKGGGFFLSASDDEPLIIRSKALYDGATPSGNSAAALVLLRLGRLTADHALEDLGRRTLEAAAPTVERSPFGSPQWLMAMDVALGPTREIVIAGDPNGAETAAMLRVVHQRFLPRAVVAVHPPSGPSREAIETLAPYVKDQGMVNGKPTAYVCEQYRCNLPVTDPQQLSALLESSTRGAQ